MPRGEICTEMDKCDTISSCLLNPGGTTSTTILTKKLEASLRAPLGIRLLSSYRELPGHILIGLKKCKAAMMESSSSPMIELGTLQKKLSMKPWRAPLEPYIFDASGPGHRVLNGARQLTLLTTSISDRNSRDSSALLIALQG